jgi:dipeptide/tripeptide permease
MSNPPVNTQGSPAAAAAAVPATTAVTERRHFSPTFWMLNIIEMWERLAYYVLRPVAPIYIMQATEPGGLHLTAAHKGTIYAWWAIFQSLLPMVTGGFADRYGYKRTLFFSFTLNIAGYLMMAFFPSYWGFFGGIIVLATGTAFFKPALQGTLAHTLNKASASLGWGIFYWIVNVARSSGTSFHRCFWATPTAPPAGVTCSSPARASRP